MELCASYPIVCAQRQFFKEEIIQKKIMLRRERGSGLLVDSCIVEQAAYPY